MTGTTQRLFFALWPDEAIRREVAGRLNNIALPVGARKVSAANLHLTLVFVGAVNTAARACMENAAAQLKERSFALSLTRIGYWQQPRVIWLTPTQTPPPLLSLVRSLEVALTVCNFTRETRPYRPHITLARNVKEYFMERVTAPLSWRVEGFSLVESCNETDGVSYRVLNSWALRGASPEPSED